MGNFNILSFHGCYSFYVPAMAINGCDDWSYICGLDDANYNMAC